MGPGHGKSICMKGDLTQNFGPFDKMIALSLK